MWSYTLMNALENKTGNKRFYGFIVSPIHNDNNLLLLKVINFGSSLLLFCKIMAFCLFLFVKEVKQKAIYSLLFSC